MVPSSNLGQVIFSNTTNLRADSSDYAYSNELSNNNQLNSDISKTYDIRCFNLESIYFASKSIYFLWLENKFSKSYAKEMSNTAFRLFEEYKCENIKDILSVISTKKMTERRVSTAYRVFLNFLEYKEILDDDTLIKLRKKIKLNITTNFDTYVPSSDEIEDTFKVIKEILNEKDQVLYSLILESGCRTSELKEFIINFDIKKVEYSDNSVIYRNFYLRKSKNSYYLFFTKNTFDKFLNLNIKYTSNEFDRFKERISRNKEIINLKYLRKYQFTLLIKADVNIEIANFIQGRSCKDIGFNHYLAKKEISIKEYKKIIEFF